MRHAGAIRCRQMGDPGAIEETSLRVVQHGIQYSAKPWRRPTGLRVM
jgi:hypothetical protein